MNYILFFVMAVAFAGCKNSEPNTIVLSKDSDFKAFENKIKNLLTDEQNTIGGADKTTC